LLSTAHRKVAQSRDILFAIDIHRCGSSPAAAPLGWPQMIGPGPLHDFHSRMSRHDVPPRVLLANQNLETPGVYVYLHETPIDLWVSISSNPD
jgi:small neutral amino acid transporter SnatA (MarC family)